MMNFSSINVILVFLINVIGMWLAIWVYSANPKLRINRIFSFTTFLALTWIDFCYLANTAKNASEAFFWTRLAEGAVLLLLTGLYFFSVYFPREAKRPPFLDKIVVFLAVFLIFLVSFTNFVTKEMVKVGIWGFSPTPGKLWILFNATSFLITILVLYFFFKKYLTFSREEKLKIQYFLIGAFIFIGMNIIFNIILPSYYRDYRFVQFGTNSTIFLLGFTAYAIVKRHLFGIRVVLTEILVGAIGVLLFLQILISKTSFEVVWKTALLVLFLIFGYSLVRSVIREIKYREQLQKAYDDLKKLDKAKSEFISIASHQLRTPLENY